MCDRSSIFSHISNHWSYKFLTAKEITHTHTHKNCFVTGRATLAECLDELFI